MKIAFITDDGKTISKHFGRAQHYLAITVEDGREVSREMRDKLSHTHFVTEPHAASETQETRHGFSPQEQNRHFQMAVAIADCEALVCGGMGAGAYNNINERGIKPMLTDVSSIDEALKAYVEGRLVDRAADMLH